MNDLDAPLSQESRQLKNADEVQGVPHRQLHNILF